MADVIVAAATDCGRKRQDNQDYHAFFPPGEGRRNHRGTLMVLADGMGGHRGGATASQTAVTAVMENYYRQATGSIAEALEQSFQVANTAVFEKSQADAQLAGMGCTLTAAVFNRGWMHWAHVGDSRGYWIHDRTITQFTEDHSFVANLVRAGAISAEDAAQRTDHNVLTRAVGIGAELKVDHNPKPVLLKKGDYVLLCCDGLWGVVSTSEIFDTIATCQHPQAICNRLVELANAAGGPDNITVMVAAVAKTHWLAGLVSPFMR